MKKVLALLIVLLLTVALVGCEDFDPAHHPLFEPTNRYLQNEIDDLQSQLDDLEEEVREGFADELPQIYYSQDEVDQLIQEQIDELELIIDNLEEIIFENQRRLDEEYNIPLDIEIMYGEMAGVEVSMDGDPNNDYVLVTVNGVEYKTFHISDEPVYWYSDMVVIRIGDVYLSYVDRGE